MHDKQLREQILQIKYTDFVRQRFEVAASKILRTLTTMALLFANLVSTGLVQLQTVE